jgi:hypothetical protein
MLIPSHHDIRCKDGFYDGECCCNCIHRYLIVDDNTGFPMGYVCATPIMGGELSFISYEGHGLCECHENINLTGNINATEILG